MLYNRLFEVLIVIHVRFALMLLLFILKLWKLLRKKWFVLNLYECQFGESKEKNDIKMSIFYSREMQMSSFSYYMQWNFFIILHMFDEYHTLTNGIEDKKNYIIKTFTKLLLYYLKIFLTWYSMLT